MPLPLLVLLVAGLSGPLLLVALPLWVRLRQAANSAALARERRGRDSVLARGLLVRRRARLPSVVAADESGLELKPVWGRATRLAWRDVERASWSRELPGGAHLRDPDSEEDAPVLTLETRSGPALVLVFRSSQAVLLAGALSLRLGDRAPDFS